MILSCRGGGAEVLDGVVRELGSRSCPTPELLYDHMASQSAGTLPILYRPFDAADAGHWADRGLVLDFLESTRARGARVLDLGPGDGWPSLPLAPFAREVVGVDASARRVEVCAANARRLGIANARFVFVRPGEPLPFPDGSFEAVTAASSLEQTPDPPATLREIHRLLAPGGRLRVRYEALGRYAPDRLREWWAVPAEPATSLVLLFDRDPARERVRQVALTVERPVRALEEAFRSGALAAYPHAVLAAWRPWIRDARHAETRHPSGRTLARWLREAGFAEILPSGDGGEAARRLFARLAPDERPRDLAGVDAVLADAVATAVREPAPLRADPPLTAVRAAPDTAVPWSAAQAQV